MHRKSFFQMTIFIASLFGIAGFGLTGAQAAAPAQVKTQAPGFYRMMLGDFEVTALSDGSVPREVDKLMSKPEEVRRVLARDHESLPLQLSINGFLINTGNRLILVDTGTGKRADSPTSGRLLANLRAAGYRPDQVDAILLTHMHGDHNGGLSVNGKRVFPNAVVYVNKRELDYWFNPAGKQFSEKMQRRVSKLEHARMDPYIKAGKLQTFEGATRLFPGISTVPAYGHTPGHTAYMVESQGNKLLLWGDIIHCAEVQFADPSVTISYDSDPAMAEKTRLKILAEAASQGFLVGAAHISFPGIGHVRADASGYSWIPVPYNSAPGDPPRP
jgi:glyoxylase-like metal-dependent hydrolase (beta-lactamase superfamily II)